MAHALQEFLNKTDADTIRANTQWELEAASGYSDIDNVLVGTTMYVQNFDLPNRTLEFANVSYKGAEFSNLVPVSMKWETEHTVTVIADVNGENRRAFLAWQGKVINPDIEGGSKFEGDRRINSKSVVRIRLLDFDNNEVVETYKFFNVKISNVGPLSLVYEGGDKATFQVTFKSTYWVIEDSKKGGLIGQK